MLTCSCSLGNPISDLLGMRKLLEGAALIIKGSEAVLSTGALKGFFLTMYNQENGSAAGSLGDSQSEPEQ